MTRHALPIASLVFLLALAVGVSIPGQSFAASAGAESADSGDSFDISAKGKKSGNGGNKSSTDDVLEAIYTLGGLLDFKGPDGPKGDRSESDFDDSDVLIDLIQDGPKRKLPPIDKKIDGGGLVLTSPVPEPTAALLFGFGILVVATQRSRVR